MLHQVRDDYFMDSRFLLRMGLKQILLEDPFSVHDLANYEIYEFTPTIFSDNFRDIIFHNICVIVDWMSEDVQSKISLD